MDSITEIMVNGTENIFYDKGGRLYRTDRHFISEERLCDVIQQIVGETNRYVNESSPVVDARLRDGSRVNVVLKPVAVNGPIMTIRNSRQKRSLWSSSYGWEALRERRRNLSGSSWKQSITSLVSGGDRSREDDISQCNVGLYSKEERIITIEDNAELQIQGVDNLVRLEARGVNLEEKAR